MAILFGVFMLTRYGIGMKMRKCAARIMDELTSKQATGPESAVLLDWAKPNPFKFGLRDFRPKVLKDMVAAGVVSQAADGKYYLSKQWPD